MRNDLVAAMEPQQLRALRLIGFALCSGAVLFAVVATGIGLMGAGAEPTDVEPDTTLVQMLSMVHMFMIVTMLAMATIVPSKLAANLAPEQAQMPYILRWALVEGAALFGCVVVLIAGTNGVLPAEPVYYANLLSVVAMVSFVFTDLGRLKDIEKGG